MLRKTLLYAVLAVAVVFETGWNVPVFAATPQLYLFNWSEYIDPKIVKKFEAKYHVKVVQSYYDGNAELFAKLQAGGDSQYDVIVPSSYFLPRLIDAGLIQKLDHKELPNIGNLLPKFQNPDYDPHDTYSVPYQWGTTGIAYNAAKLKNAPQSWSLVFDPKENPKYPFAMLLGDGQTLFGAACAYLKLGYNCTGKDPWVKAAKLIIQNKKRRNFTGFVDGTPVLQQLARGVVDVGITFNGDFLYAAGQNPSGFKNIKYFLPKEGTELWVDTMAIPDKAPHPKLAHEFINYILNAKIGAELSNWNSYASPNAAAKPYLDADLAKPPITPTPKQMKRLHFTPSLQGQQLKLFEQLWTEVRSR